MADSPIEPHKRRHATKRPEPGHIVKVDPGTTLDRGRR
jgi:hypothetical protein